MAKLRWDIVWTPDPNPDPPAEPPIQELELEDPVSWIYKAVPGPEPDDPEGGNTTVEPVVYQYEIIDNQLNSSIIVDISNVPVGCVFSGDAGNPFPFDEITYVEPKDIGYTPINVSFIEDLPDWSTIDLTACIPSDTAEQTDSITLKAYARDYDDDPIDGEYFYEATATYYVTTTNNIGDTIGQTIQDIVNA